MKPGDMVRRFPKYGRTIIYKDEKANTFLRFIEDDEISTVLDLSFDPHMESLKLIKVLNSDGSIGWIYTYEMRLLDECG